jgi:E3 ubiquitin-protein ligase MARCH6
MKKFWKVLCAQLRLSSFMLGKRHPSEEFTPKQWFSYALFVNAPTVELQDAEKLRDGSFRRVPANDSVELGKNVRLPVHVDELGQPLNERAERLIQAQDAEAVRAGREPSTDFTVVYIPPHFGIRITLFIIVLWLVSSAFIAGVISVPTLFGRGLLSATLHREVHDGYAFLAGFYALWGAWTIGKSLDRLDKRRQRERDWEGPNAPWGLWVAKRILRWVANIFYMLLTVGIVAPILVALVVEMYLVLPLRLTMNPGMPIRIRIVDMWMMGILYMKIILRTRGVQAPTTFIRGVERVSLLFSFYLY